MHLLVLSAFRPPTPAPRTPPSPVSMHLLVLSAFRLGAWKHEGRFERVSMHLLVLSAFRPHESRCCAIHSQCLNAPSGAQCFPTGAAILTDDLGNGVSMHLLVLSAFRPTGALGKVGGAASLNAPSGAQCFPTPPPENRATTPFTGTKSPPTWKAPHRIGSHLSN